MTDAVRLARALLAFEASTRQCKLCQAPEDAIEECHAQEHKALLALAKKILKQASNAPN